MDLLFDAVGNSTVTTTIAAGGAITSGPGDGNPETFESTIIVDGVTTIQAGESIDLNNAQIQVEEDNNTSSSSLTLNAQGGTLELSESNLSSAGNLTLQSTGNQTLDSATLSATDNSGTNDILLDSGGSISLTGGSINEGALENAANNETGSVIIESEDDVDLSDTSITIDTSRANTNITNANADTATVFLIDSGGDLNLGEADIDIEETGGNANIQLLAANNIDLTNIDLLFDAVGNSAVATTIEAGGAITSGPGDGNPETFESTIIVDGATTIGAGTGDIDLSDADLSVNSLNITNTSDLQIRASEGNINLGESNLNITDDTGTDLTVFAGENVDLGTSEIATGGVFINAGDTVVATENTIAVNDFEIFGFDPDTLAPDPLLPVAGNVNLNLSTEGDMSNPNVNVTVVATGDINITQSGGRSITATRPNAAAPQSSIRSTEGNITIQSDGDLNLGASSAVGTPASIQADGDGDSEVTVTLNAANINDVNGNIGALDISSANNLVLSATETIGVLGGSTDTEIEVAAPAITLDLSGTMPGSSGGGPGSGGGPLVVSPSNAGNIDISGANELLQVRSNSSEFIITQDNSLGASTTLLDLNQSDPTDPNSARVLNIPGDDTGVDPGLAPTTVIFTEATGDIQIGSVATRVENLGIEAENGDILGASTLDSNGNDITVSGNLILSSGGEVGSEANPILVSAGAIAVSSQGTNAVDQIFIETNNDAGLNVDNVTLAGEELLSFQASGLQSDGDISVSLTSDGANGTPVLTQSAVIDSSNGSVAVSLANGDFIQNEALTTSSSNVDITLNNGNLTQQAPIQSDDGNISITVGSAAASGNGSFTQNSSLESATGDININTTGDFTQDGTAASVNGSNLDLQVGGNLTQSGNNASVSGNDLSLQVEGDLNQTADTSNIQGANSALLNIGGSLNQDNTALVSAPSLGLALGDGLQQTSTTALVQGSTVAIQSDGDVGSITGDQENPTIDEATVSATNLLVDVTSGGDLAVQQNSGDLNIIEQATIGGQNFTTTGADGDLRIRVTAGSLNVNSDLDIGGNGALVTGSAITGSVLGGNNIILNNSVSSENNLVILSQGSLQQASGTVSAPSLGLGAAGDIGSTTAPIQIQTDNLAINRVDGQVNDPNGFTEVDSVTANGVTVNRAIAPVGTTPPPAVAAEAAPVVTPEAFAQNEVDLVEDVIRTFGDVDVERIIRLDPSRLPVRISDEEFLRKKFR